MIEVIVPDYSELEVIYLDFDQPAQVNRSAWTGVKKVVGLPGASLWKGAVRVNSIATEAEERKWRAFTSALRGVQNWFKVLLPCQSHIGPAPVVAIGAGDSYSLNLAGMSPDTRILEAGQHMTVPLPSGHQRCVRLTADLMTDSTGSATAQFAPSLNEKPVIGSVVETANPFVPVSATETFLTIPQGDAISSLSFEVEEAR